MNSIKEDEKYTSKFTNHNQNKANFCNMFLVGATKGLYLFHIEPKRNKIKLIDELYSGVDNIVAILCLNAKSQIFLSVSDLGIMKVFTVDRLNGKLIELAS